MQQVFNEYPPLYGTDDILYHIGRLLEDVSGKEQDTTAIINGLKTAIGNDVNLQNVLRGKNGNQTHNYGRSLLQNGALESGSLSFWESGEIEPLNEKLNAIKSKNRIYRTDNFFVVPDKLYKLECSIKVDSGYANIILICRDKNNQNAPKLNGVPFVQKIFNVNSTNSLFITESFFFGGVGTLQSNISENTISLNLFLEVQNVTQGFCYFKNLMVKEVDLGEPVPYTLPYLPTGQLVYDPVTNDVGRFNGTDINWFM